MSTGQLLTDADCRKFSDLIRRKTGMIIDDAKLPRLELCLTGRMRTVNLPDAAKYYDLLHFSEDGDVELRELIDGILINETLFYRNIPQMELLEREVFPQLIAERGRSPEGSDAEPIRVWSAGCSTGAEPFSIVMAFEEARRAAGGTAAVDVHVLGTDLSTQALAEAAEAVYERRPVENTPPHIIDRYFIKEKDRYRVADEIRKRVSFRQHNLVDPGYPDGFDIVFCRNVIIYFDDATRELIVERFYHSLKADGAFFIGHTETLLDWPEYFQPVFHGDALYYRKWSTDKRRHEKPGMATPQILEQRVAPEKRPPVDMKMEEWRLEKAGGEFKTDILVVSGLLDINTPREKFKNQITIFLSKPASMKVVDLWDVVYMTNEFLRTFRQALAAMKSEGMTSLVISPKDYMGFFQTALLDDVATVVSCREAALRTAEAAGAVHAAIQPRVERPAPPAAIRSSPAERRRVSPPSNAERVRRAMPSVRVLYENSHAEIRLEGNLDTEKYPDLIQRLKKAVADAVGNHRTSGMKSMCVAFGRIAFISADIAPVISRAAVLAREHNIAFRVEAEDERTKRFLSRCGVPLRGDGGSNGKAVDVLSREA